MTTKQVELHNLLDIVITLATRVKALEDRVKKLEARKRLSNEVLNGPGSVTRLPADR